jgi:HEPN domain-containing protein
MTTDQIDYLKNWLYRADEDILVIKNLFESDPEAFASSICFHAQQAVEKYLKAFLVYHNIDFPKTHDLDFLLIECKKIDDKIFDIDLGSLTDFGVSIRYPDDFYLPDKDETLFFRQIAFKIKEIVETNINLKQIT